MTVVRRAVAQSLTRAQAARLLRAARAAFARDPDSAGEKISWAVAALRDSRQARRLKVDFLLHSGNFDSADALLARSLMRDSERPLTRLRYARSLFLQERIEQAEGEVRRVLIDRPRHVGAMRLAARIAEARGDWARAVAHLEAAAGAGPNHEQIQNELIAVLLRSGRVHRAGEVLGRLHEPPALLRAQLLRALGRPLEAREALEAALAGSPVAAAADELLCELIEVLEHLGDLESLRALINTIPAARSRSRLRGATALIGLGDHEAAAARLAMLSHEPTVRRDALGQLVVAAALAGQVDRAREALRELAVLAITRSRLQTGPFQRSDVHAIACAWIGGLLSRTLAEQISSAGAGCDPSLSLLQPLLHQAVSVFDAALGHQTASLTAQDQASLRRHRALCLQAMGRPLQAAAALAPDDCVHAAA
jgi:tetratricopeptide (TPR) repeat protein